MTSRSLPRYVTSFVGTHGTVRYRFRRKGFPCHYFGSRPGSRDFAVEYDSCLKGTPAKPVTAPFQQKPKAQAAPLPSKVYFIGGEDGPIKIGRSNNPSERLANLRSSSPTELFIMAEIEGGITTERYFHQRFSHLRLRGEWFERSADLMAEITSIRDIQSLTGV